MATYELDTHSLLCRLAQGDDAEALSELLKFEERSGLRDSAKSYPASNQDSSGRSTREADGPDVTDFTHYRRDSGVSGMPQSDAGRSR